MKSSPVGDARSPSTTGRATEAKAKVTEVETAVLNSSGACVVGLLSVFCVCGNEVESEVRLGFACMFRDNCVGVVVTDGGGSDAMWCLFASFCFSRNVLLLGLFRVGNERRLGSGVAVHDGDIIVFAQSVLLLASTMATATYIIQMTIVVC